MVLLDKSPLPVSLEVTSKIMQQMKTCIFKIFVSEKGDKLEGTGFFCLIPFKNKNLPVMITNNHLLYEEILKKEKYVSIQINGLNKNIQINDNRKIYTNKNYDITIIEIIPEKDNIFNFLELDEQIFEEDSDKLFYRLSIYLLFSGKTSCVSYGIIAQIKENHINDIFHLCSSEENSGGGPIMSLRTNKVIGFHIGGATKMNYNIGGFIKYPFNEFINLNKDYISSNGVCSENIWNKSNKNNNNNINTSEEVLGISNKDLEEKLKLEKEKNKQLEDKINNLNALLKNNINNIRNNNNNNINVGNPNDLLQSIIKKDKVIEDLRLKLSRFPFELSEGEKLISIIFTSTDQKIHYSVICKNTDIFYNLELKLYQKYNEYSELENYFTVNGRRVNKTKNLEFNKIKDNDIIFLNTLDI